MTLRGGALLSWLGLLAACIEPGPAPSQVDLFEPRELVTASGDAALASAALTASATTSASSAPAKKESKAIEGPRAQEGESRVEQCNVEILARDLYAPGWLFTGRDGKVYAVESDTIKRKSSYDHRARAFDVSGRKPRLIADVAARLGEAALVGDDLFLRDVDSGELVRIPIATGKRTGAGEAPHAIAAQGDVLVRATVTPERVELDAPSGLVARLSGKWSDDDLTMAFSPTHAYFFVFPHADDVGTTQSVIAGHLARAPLGGQAELLGTVHIAGPLAVGGGFLFAGSLTSLLRMNERTGEWQRAPNGGAEQIAADASAAVWTESERGTVMFWPHTGKPFLACEGIPGVGAVALNEKYVYFSAYGADLTAGGATIGRFARPR